jgi:hypothetical protein
VPPFLRFLMLAQFRFGLLCLYMTPQRAERLPSAAQEGEILGSEEQGALIDSQTSS